MMNKTEKITSLLLLLAIAAVDSWPGYRKRIPNGDKVPCKCVNGMLWKPVGHYNDKLYTKLKNPFGLDFRNSSFSWTKELCEADSDRDGRTNGEELGDPNCVWKMTDNVKPQLKATGHPGICEPIGSVKCRYQKFSCECLKDINICTDLVGGE